MGTITINKLIGGNIKITSTGGGSSEPTGWKGLKFENTGEDDATITLAKNRTAPELTLMYSLDDGQTWNDFVVCSSTTSLDGTIITLTSGLGVCFKAGEGGNNSFATSVNNFNQFVMSGEGIKASGNINSLLDGDNFEEIDDLTGKGYCFTKLFWNCISLVYASELQLPATTLDQYCYTSMFYGCSSLISAPQILPATKLVRNGYYSMFYGCTSLTQAPELQATTLASSCCGYMFYGCTLLERIKMNASSSSWGSSMFDGCTSLELVDMTGSTDVPQLSNVNNFSNTNNTYKIVVPDSLYDTWITATNWSSASIKPRIMKQSDWNSAHPDDILGQ